VPRPPPESNSGGRPNSVATTTSVASSRPTALQVIEQSRERQVQLDDQLVLLELALIVGVPAGAVEEVEVMSDLDEPAAGLDQAAGQQAALAELAAVGGAARRRLAVEPEDVQEGRAGSRAASRPAAA